MVYPDFSMIAPQIILIAMALILPGVYFLLKDEKVLAGLSMVAILAAIGSTAYMMYEQMYGDFAGIFRFDQFSALLILLFLAVVFLVVLTSLKHVERDKHHAEYYSLLLGATAGMMFVASATDLIAIFIGVELTSITSYALVAFRKNDPRAAEASVKYLIIGGLSTALSLYGFSLLYGVTGSTNLADIGAAISAAPSGMLLVSVAAMMAGLGFKISAVPFHMWAPDVYEGASTPITTFLAVGSKKMGFVALFKVFLVCFVLGQAVMVSEIQMAFAVLAAITMTVGNVVAISQTNIKRMLAYSSISQAGYLMIVLAVGTEYALAAGIFHMITHVFMKGGAFIVVAALCYAALGEHLNDYKGLAKRAPLVAFAMMLFLFSLAGIPPLAGFVSKFVLFSSAISEPGAAASMQWVWLVLIAVINSAISLYYYARVVKYMYIEEGESKEPISLPWTYALAIGICVLAVVVIGIYPEPVISACEAAAAALMS